MGLCAGAGTRIELCAPLQASRRHGILSDCNSTIYDLSMVSGKFNSSLIVNHSINNALTVIPRVSYQLSPSVARLLFSETKVKG